MFGMAHSKLHNSYTTNTKNPEVIFLSTVMLSGFSKFQNISCVNLHMFANYFDTYNSCSNQTQFKFQNLFIEKQWPLRILRNCSSLLLMEPQHLVVFKLSHSKLNLIANAIQTSKLMLLTLQVFTSPIFIPKKLTFHFSLYASSLVKLSCH